MLHNLISRSQHSGKDRNNGDCTQKESIKSYGLFLIVLTLLIFGFGLLVLFAWLWAHRTWPGLTIDEMVFHLTAPVEGTGGGIFLSLFLQAFLPAAIIEACVVFFSLLIRKKYRKVSNFVVSVELFSGVLMIALSIFQFSQETNLSAYIAAQNSDSDFIETNYADPAETEIVFPEKKRNLIYIYLESMETTYSDTEDGGAFDKNVIPELTELAQENECFSGGSGQMDGGIVYPNSGFTMAGIFAQTSGVPLQISLGNNMDTQESFFPGLCTLGDILAGENYRQIFLIGSDATFGGRRLYFQNHGNYEFRDYNWAVGEHLIPADYYRWWGYEDEKLFSYAKNTLKELSEGSQPFNLTMLTVDTHAEDGYVCDLCKNAFGDNQYANVVACSSRQVYDFVRWVQQQDFYENTTIILSGDHTTMDSDFCEDISPDDYQRKTFVCVINPGAEKEKPEWERQFSTLDMFPTTLASLGAQIQGDKLGLGVNLFSSRETLTESYGQERMQTEMNNRSEFLQSKSQIGITDELAERIRNDLQVEFQSGENPDTLRIVLKNIDVPSEKAEVIFSPDGNKNSDQAVTAVMESINDTSESGSSDSYTVDIVIPDSFRNQVHVWFSLSYDDGSVLISNEYKADMDELEEGTATSS